MNRRVLAVPLLTLLAAAAAYAQTAEQIAKAQQVSTAPPDAATVVGPPQGTPLTGEALERQTHKTAAELRCPVCQGLSVFDSPAEMAVNMKHQVRDLHAQGFTQEQILQYFEKSYGEFVRLNPPLRGVNWLVWLAPLIALGLGGIIIWWFFRQSQRTTSDDVTPEEAEEAKSTEIAEARAPEDDPELLPYILKVRELAYGWPDGVKPKK